MKKIIYLMIACLIFYCSHALAKTVISNKSGHLKYGVRLYSGNLPPEIECKSLGEVETEAKSGGISFVDIREHNLALEKLLYEARKLGANAIINIRSKSSGIKIAEAVFVKEFPDSYTEEDFKRFTHSS